MLPIGSDPHSYQAAPSDVAKIAGSNVLILNGLKYEQFIEPLLENAGGERLIVEASAGLTPHTLEAQSGEGQDPAAGDPHMWLDPIRVIRYVENIRDGLSKADPEGREVYKANADAYITRLKGLDTWITEQVKVIPTDSSRVR